MPLTNNLKPQVDLPIWEWCRFAPTASTNVSGCTSSGSGTDRYIYYQVSTLLYRYDTYSDSWHQLATTGATTPTIYLKNVLSNKLGHYGQAISGGANTITLAGLSGNSLVGKTIRILSGTGAGQSRVILSVAAPTTHARGICTSASGVSAIDASTGTGIKQWKSNQWKNYQVRFEFNTGRTQVRPILHNTLNTLTFTDINHITVNPWAQVTLATNTVASNTIYVIESHVVTVDSAWTTQPDNTSNFVIESGGIFVVTQATTSSPFFTLLYYDILADTWYQKSTQTGIKGVVFAAASDIGLIQPKDSGSPLLTDTVTGATARSISPTNTMTPMDYANMAITITGGTGIGQTRTILSNTDARINVTRDWDTTPDNTSTFEIDTDNDKLFLAGGGDSALLQYSIESDEWSTGKQFDFGQCNQLAAKKVGNGDAPFAITNITRTAAGITVLNATPTAGGSGYNIDDILTITTGGTGGTARVTAISSTGAVTAVSLETTGTNYTTGAGKVTTVSPAGGTGCTLDITTIDFTALCVTPIAHTFKIGDSVVVSGATGTGSGSFNGTKTILSVNTANNLSFSYALGGDPGAASASIAAVPSTTQLVDCTKNWVVNEHVGKIVQLSSNAVYSAGQQRRIVSNTATTLVWTLAATAPVNGTSRYIIEDIKPFGTERSLSVQEGMGTEGFATGGSTTTLVDTTKNWITNFWSRGASRKVRIVEGTGVGTEIPILSNTDTTLTYALQSFTPDATTRYVIMDTFGTATSGTTTSLSDTSQNWNVNLFVGKRLRIVAGTGVSTEVTISSNTATTLSFGAITAPDTSTAYAILESPQRTFGTSLEFITESTDTSLNSRYLYSFTGTSTAEITRYNINTEHWEFLNLYPQSEVMGQGSMFCYDKEDRIYFWSSVALRLMYLDITTNTIYPAGTPPYGMGAVISGNRLEIIKTADDLKYLYLMRHTGTEMWRTLLYV